jgi:hypothetical protein
MKVVGLTEDGELSEIQISSKSDVLLSISERFQECMSHFPSVETENSLIELVTETEDSEYSKVIRFQCQREIVRSKMKRDDHRHSIWRNEVCSLVVFFSRVRVFSSNSGPFVCLHAL